MTHKHQPLARLLRASMATYDKPELTVLSNTDHAVARILGTESSSLKSWLYQRLEEASSPQDFQRASSALAEVRSAGAILTAFGNCSPIRRGSDPTPEFEVAVGGQSFVVETHAKQMNEREADALAEFLHREHDAPDDGLQLGPSGIREHRVQPAGARKPGETAAENVASKFANIKPGARQAAPDRPSLLWLDLQDQDWWSLGHSDAVPVRMDRGAFLSSGLWHAFYGTVGTPLLEGQNAERRAPKTVAGMRFPGMFEQTSGWSAVVLGFSRATIVFEHPEPKRPLTRSIHRRLVLLPRLSFPLCIMNWPLGAEPVQKRIARERALLKHLAQEISCSD